MKTQIELIQKAIRCIGTQKDLAEATKVSQQAVSLWLTEKSTPSPMSAKLIQDATDGGVLAHSFYPELFSKPAPKSNV